MAKKCGVVCKTNNVLKNIRTPAGQKALGKNAQNWILSIPPLSLLRVPRLTIKTISLYRRLSKSRFAQSEIKS